MRSTELRVSCLCSSSLTEVNKLESWFPWFFLHQTELSLGIRFKFEELLKRVSKREGESRFTWNFQSHGKCRQYRPGHWHDHMSSPDPWASLLAHGEESACQCWGHRFDSWVGKIPWRRDPPQYSCLERSIDRGVRQATVHGITRELDKT